MKKKTKPTLNLVRKIKFWVIYDSKRKRIVDEKPFKYQLREPRRGSGLHLVEMTGFYVRPPSPQSGDSNG